MRKFNPTAKRFSRLNLAYLANLAELAYESKQKIGIELTNLGFDVSRDNYFFSIKGTDTQAFVVGDSKKIIIAFRGTEGKLRDWVTDGKIAQDIWTKKNPLGEVHCGFYEAFISIWNDLLKEIKTLRNNNQSIWITGHSLGGALATLAAATMELQQPKIEINGVYTFGQPRIGDKEFSRSYNSKIKQITFRCVNNNDVVTRVPPQMFNYSHVGKLKYFDHKGNLRSDNNLSWWSRFWDGIEGRFSDMLDLTPDGIEDHSMKRYKRFSERALKKK